MDLIKFKLSFKQMKKQDIDWEKISARHVTEEKAYIWNIKRVVQVNNDKRNNPIPWWAKKL